MNRDRVKTGKIHLEHLEFRHAVERSWKGREEILPGLGPNALAIHGLQLALILLGHRRLGRYSSEVVLKVLADAPTTRKHDGGQVLRKDSLPNLDGQVGC